MSDEEKKEEVKEVEATEEKIETKEEAKAESAVETAVEKEVPAETVEEVKTEEKKAEKAEPKGDHADLIKKIEKMSVLELSELVKALEDRFGVSASAPAMMMAAGTPAGGATEAVEEKTSFTVVLSAAGDQKIAVIKAVREIRPDLGLVDAKTLVESAPKEVLKDAKKEDAETAKTKLETAGAKVELK